MSDTNLEPVAVVLVTAIRNVHGYPEIRGFDLSMTTVAEVRGELKVGAKYLLMKVTDDE